MNDIAPQHALERAVRLWWLIAACAFLGGVAGWTFSLFRAPVYEATAFYHVSVDSAEVARRLGRDPQIPLEFSQVRPYIDPLEAAFYQRETQDALLSAAQAQGIPAEAVDLHDTDFSLDRNGVNWFVTVRKTDPQLAAQVANLWLETVDGRVQAMLAHAYRAESLDAVRSAVIGCLSSVDLEQVNACAGTAFGTLAEFQAYVDGLGRQAVAERQASGGLDTVLEVRPDRPARPPAGPVLYRQGALILAGSLAGFLFGSGLLQFGFPGSGRRDRK